MVRGGTAEPELVDGRRARRERGRSAVIDAVFELLQEGRIPPPVEEVADRAQVSPSTVFRYFDGLEDMQHQALTRFRERFGHLFDIPTGAATPHERIAQFVDARLTLYEKVGTIMLVSRLRALDHEPLAIATIEQNARLANQAAEHFDAELDAVTPARRTDLIAVIDSLTGPEAWDTMRRSHQRTSRQIKRAWCDALAQLVPDPSISQEAGP